MPVWEQGPWYIQAHQHHSLNLLPSGDVCPLSLILIYPMGEGALGVGGLVSRDLHALTLLQRHAQPQWSSDTFASEAGDHRGLVFHSAVCS